MRLIHTFRPAELLVVAKMAYPISYPALHPQYEDVNTSGQTMALMNSLMNIQKMKDDKARQELQDRIDAEDRARRIAEENFKSDIEVADLAQKIHGLTARGMMPDISGGDQVAMPVGGNVSPQEDLGLQSAVPQGAPSAVPLGTGLQGSQVTQKKVAAPKVSIRLPGGGSMSLPLMDKEEIAGQAIQRDIDSGKLIDAESPEIQAALRELPPGLAALIKVGSVKGPDGKTYISTSGLSGAAGALAKTPTAKSEWGQPFTGPDDVSYQRNTDTGEIRRTPGVGRAPDKDTTKGKFVTMKTPDGKQLRVWATNEQIASAPPGTYTDEKPPKANAPGIRANLLRGIDRMGELIAQSDAAVAAGKPGMTTGFIRGNISKEIKERKGPSAGQDPEYEFDRLGDQMVDLVYEKSGKQINENEMRIIRRQIPSRGRDNLAEQFRIWSQTVNTILNKYGTSLDGPDIDPNTKMPVVEGEASEGGAVGPPPNLEDIIKRHGGK